MPFIVHGQDAIWGYGATEDAAWAHFLAEMTANGIEVVQEVPDDPADYGSTTLESDYEVSAATEALVKEVQERGGNIAWGFIGGGCVAGTRDEYDPV